MRTSITRRSAVTGGLAGGLMLVSPASLMAQTGGTAALAETASGKVRGSRSNGVSSFLAIPYGGDTGRHRFQPARPPQPWTGVRDCLAYGARAPQVSQGGGGPPSAYTLVLGALFGSVGVKEGPENEDCLVLNVFTLDASTRRKRPVMVWLHGGGFSQGSAGNAMYEGGALCRRGDVVVVTLNHRLNAMGYLYLGDLHSDFADSGNVGQLDIVLALQWVRDNIAAFGGDAGNVTIFGESGGGSKVATLLGMPVAQGLFHKAIQQSGAVLSVVERAGAAALAERTLAALGIARADVHQLQKMDWRKVIVAAQGAQGVPGAPRASLSPVLDGRSVPAHPFEPRATELSRNVPLIIGTNKDEQTLFMAGDPDFGKMTAEQVRARFAVAGDKAQAAFDTYRALRPNDPPTYWLTSFMTDRGVRGNSIKQAERKAAQNAAPVFMYRLDWETPVMGGALRAPHGLDTALVFDNADAAAGMAGTGPEPRKLAADMSQAWVNFAHSGNPSRKGLAWPRYEAGKRETMIFDVPSHVVPDPDRERRLLWG